MGSKYKKRSDGLYIKNILTGYTADGKSKYKSIYAKTIDELERKAAAFKLAQERGIAINEENLTVEKWATQWFETYKAQREYKTQEMYKNIIKKHILPEIGALRLKDI